MTRIRIHTGLDCCERLAGDPMLEELKNKLGPLWYYAALIFIAQRLGDVINTIIGLWLVPKYVCPSELGAVLALAQVGGVLGIPLAILLVPFEKFLNIFAVHAEYGKVKSLLRDALILVALSIVGAYACSFFLMPHVYERMRVSDGLLTHLIVISGVLTTVSPLFLVAMQAAKKFRQLSILSVLSAPVRLLVLLIALPLRGLAGYFIGQVCTDGFNMGYSLLALKNPFFTNVKCVSYWSHWREIWHYTWPIIFLTIAGRIQTTTEFFAVRHWLTDTESGAYYFITRFAEIPICLWTATRMVFFPLVSEKHDSGQNTSRMFYQTVLLILLGGGAVIGLFHIVFPFVLSLLPMWQRYMDYAPLLGVVGATCVVRTAFACFIAYETACRRFGFVVYTVAFYLIEAVLLYCIGGIGFFEGWLPTHIIQWIRGLVSLRSFSWVVLVFSVVLLFVALSHQRVSEKRIVKHEGAWA